jgi:hypothetical protein
MLILIKGPYETLNLFIDEMVAKSPTAVVLDMAEESFYKDITDLLPQLNEETVVVVFNGAGRQITYSDDRNVWREKGVRLYDFFVDHPVWYSRHLDDALPNESFLVIDRLHKEYIHKYYPELKKVYFLPHGGSRYARDIPDIPEIPYEKREIPVIYCGSCQPSGEIFEVIPYFSDQGSSFYQFVFQQMMEEFSADTAEIVWAFLKLTGLCLSQEEEMDLIYKAHLCVLPLCRRINKIKVVQALAANGIPVEIWGDHWEEAAAPYPELIKLHERTSSIECERLTADAKISLNILPFFKDGSHERIYLAMLNKTLCVSDKSHYLLEKFEHGRDIVFFNLDQLDVLCDDIKFLLNHPDSAGQIIQNAYEKVAHSQWSDRLQTILNNDFASPSIV